MAINDTKAKENLEKAQHQMAAPSLIPRPTSNYDYEVKVYNFSFDDMTNANFGLIICHAVDLTVTSKSMTRMPCDGTEKFEKNEISCWHASLLLITRLMLIFILLVQVIGLAVFCTMKKKLTCSLPFPPDARHFQVCIKQSEDCVGQAQHMMETPRSDSKVKRASEGLMQDKKREKVSSSKHVAVTREKTQTTRVVGACDDQGVQESGGHVTRVPRKMEVQKKVVEFIDLTLEDSDSETMGKSEVLKGKDPPLLGNQSGHQEVSSTRVEEAKRRLGSEMHTRDKKTWGRSQKEVKEGSPRQGRDKKEREKDKHRRQDRGKQKRDNEKYRRHDRGKQEREKDMYTRQDRQRGEDRMKYHGVGAEHEKQLVWKDQNQMREHREQWQNKLKKEELERGSRHCWREDKQIKDQEKRKQTDVEQKGMKRGPGQLSDKREKALQKSVSTANVSNSSCGLLEGHRKVEESKAKAKQIARSTQQSEKCGESSHPVHASVTRIQFQGPMTGQHNIFPQRIHPSRFDQLPQVPAPPMPPAALLAATTTNCTISQKMAVEVVPLAVHSSMHSSVGVMPLSVHNSMHSSVGVMPLAVPVSVCSSVGIMPLTIPSSVHSSAGVIPGAMTTSMNNSVGIIPVKMPSSTYSSAGVMPLAMPGSTLSPTDGIALEDTVAMPDSTHSSSGVMPVAIPGSTHRPADGIALEDAVAMPDSTHSPSGVMPVAIPGSTHGPSGVMPVAIPGCTHHPADGMALEDAAQVLVEQLVQQGLSWEAAEAKVLQAVAGLLDRGFGGQAEQASQQAAPSLSHHVPVVQRQHLAGEKQSDIVSSDVDDMANVLSGRCVAPASGTTLQKTNGFGSTGLDKKPRLMTGDLHGSLVPKVQAKQADQKLIKEQLKRQVQKQACHLQKQMVLLSSLENMPDDALVMLDETFKSEFQKSESMQEAYNPQEEAVGEVLGRVEW